MVKQEKARININILGFSELKWKEMGEFNSQESLRRNGVALTVNKRVQNAMFGCNEKGNYKQGEKTAIRMGEFNSDDCYIYYCGQILYRLSYPGKPLALMVGA